MVPPGDVPRTLGCCHEYTQDGAGSLHTLEFLFFPPAVRFSLAREAIVAVLELEVKETRLPSVPFSVGDATDVVRCGFRAGGDSQKNSRKSVNRV